MQGAITHGRIAGAIVRSRWLILRLRLGLNLRMRICPTRVQHSQSPNCDMWMRQLPSRGRQSTVMVLQHWLAEMTPRSMVHRLRWRSSERYCPPVELPVEHPERSRPLQGPARACV